MLSLESRVWRTLGHAYGFAHEVPRMLRTLKKNPTKKAWEDIWSSLCHQDTVYSASFAAIPHIVEMALESPSERQFDYWLFVGAVAAHASTLEGAIPDDLREDYFAALRQSIDPIRRLLLSKPKNRSEGVYLLAALAATVGCKGEGLILDYFDGDEMPGACPACSKELVVAVEADGVYLSPQDNLGTFTSITPPDGAIASKDALENLDRHSVSKWLPALAEAAGQPALASTIRTLYGSALCPACDHAFPVMEEFGRQACALNR